MNMLNVIFTVAAVISGLILAWSYTPWGKKWLKSLND